MKISKGPEEFGTNISRLGIEYKHKLPEEDKVTALVGTAGPKYATTIFNEKRMIESNDQEVIYEVLLTVLCVIWRLGSAGKDAEFKEKDVHLTNPRSFTSGKTCFYCGSTEHLKYQCSKFKAGKG